MAQVDSINYAAIEYALQDHNERYKIVIPATPCEIANSAALTWLKPNDLVRPLQALYIPAEHAVDSHMLLDKLDAALLASGGEIIEQNAATLETHGDAIAVVRLIDDRLISCKQVVVAAGVHSLSLLSKQPEVQSSIPPLFAGYGVSILAKLPEGHTMPSTVIRTPNRAFACGLHCVPRSKDVLYIGATNILVEVPRTHALISDVQFLLDCAVDQLNLDLHDAQILKVQVGNRPIPADGFPLIGQAGYEGLWLATGTYRDGLHQSPLIATYIADAMKDESDGTKAESKTLDLSVFTPLRQPLQHVKREDTVAETVRQMFATGYEYRWNVKPYWLPLLDKGMHNNYATLLDQLHPTFAPPPEIVAFSYLYPTFRERLTRYYRSWS
jgi:glycine/D-amino acid oxidase-like deaminating enzyme